MPIAAIWAGLAPPTPRKLSGRPLGRPPLRGAQLIVLPSAPVGRPPSDLQRPIDPWGLTEREAAVLLLFVRGLNTKQIARKISRSHRTVDHHSMHIRAKLGVKTTAQAVYAWHRHYKVVDEMGCDKDSSLIASLLKVTTDDTWAKDTP